MILHMIQLDPDSRCSAESYLQSYAGVVLPCYFSPFLHNLYSNLNPINPDSRVRKIQVSIVRGQSLHLTRFYNIFIYHLIFLTGSNVSVVFP